MADYTSKNPFNVNSYQREFNQTKSVIISIILFLVTIFTTAFAGAVWIVGDVEGYYSLDDLLLGIPYAFSIVFVLGLHEFGHYFAAVYHKVKSTLPYFIPFPPIPGLIHFGTMGAVIKTKSPIRSNKAMFDIGAAGPIAGFFASVAVLIYGFMNLPGEEYILNLHPDYFMKDNITSGLVLEFGDTILFSFLKDIFTDPTQFVPPMTEIYHYPYLCVGWFGLFVTSMNLIPVGQLDGGHIIYSMFGQQKHKLIANTSMIILLILGLQGVLSAAFSMDISFGWAGWLFWALVLYFIIKIKHPPVTFYSPLNSTRMYIGYFCIFIFVISFSPAPFLISVL